MNHARHPITRLAVLVTAIPGLLAVTAVRTTAMVPPPDPGGPGSSPGRLARAPAQPVAGNPDWTLRWVLLAAVGVAALTIVGVVSEIRMRRRWRRPRLEAVLETSDSDELPRAAGLLGDLLARHSHPAAAEHAYRAAIDVGDPYWSPIAQVALADLLCDRGQRAEARALLEAAIASDHPRAGPAAQARLGRLLAARSLPTAIGSPLAAYETLDEVVRTRR